MVEQPQAQAENSLVVYTLPGMEQAQVRKDLVYKTVGDLDLKLDVYYPAEYDGQSLLAAVILIHGDAPQDRLSGAKDRGQYISWGQLIAASGLIAVPFTHRSSERLTKKDEVMSDIEDLLLYVGSNSQTLHIDASRLCIWTCSAGSPFGFRAALRLPRSSLRCIVSYYSLTDLQAAYEGAEETRPRPGAEELLQYSAADQVRHRQGEVPPLFIARAGLDFPALNSSIDRLIQVALEKNVALTLMNHPSGHHAFDVRDNDERSHEIIRATLAFMQTHLAP